MHEPVGTTVTVILLASAICNGRERDKLQSGPYEVQSTYEVDYWGEPLKREIPMVKDRKGDMRPRYRINMDVYLPKDANGPRPAVLLIHGGGLGEGSPDPYRKDLGPWLASHGYAVFAPGYTLGKGLIPALVDIRQATRYIRMHADQFGADPNRIGAWGFSAGGWLASHLGVLDDGAQLEVT